MGNAINCDTSNNKQENPKTGLFLSSIAQKACDEIEFLVIKNIANYKSGISFDEQIKEAQAQCDDEFEKDNNIFIKCFVYNEDENKLAVITSPKFAEKFDFNFELFNGNISEIHIPCSVKEYFELNIICKELTQDVIDGQIAEFKEKAKANNKIPEIKIHNIRTGEIQNIIGSEDIFKQVSDKGIIEKIKEDSTIKIAKPEANFTVEQTPIENTKIADMFTKIKKIFKF